LPKSNVPIFYSLISFALPLKASSQTQERKLESRSLFENTEELMTRLTNARRLSVLPFHADTFIHCFMSSFDKK
jgi:hypothetical protein